MALSKEELEELAALEREEKEAAAVEADAVARQALEAKRMRKRLAGKNGVHGKDFTVYETTAGNIAIRRPLDVEIDSVGENAEDRAAQEKFLVGITLEPSADEMKKLLVTFPGLCSALIPRSFQMIGRVREEEAKK